jgi:hypothetical protein
MDSISQEIYDEGAEYGSRKTLLENVRSLMETMGLSALTALEKLRVPEAGREKYLAMLRDAS